MENLLHSKEYWNLLEIDIIIAPKINQKIDFFLN